MNINIAQLKKKIIYRSNYRGTKEMDKLLGAFTNKYINELSNEDLTNLEKLLEIDDNNLYNFCFFFIVVICIRNNIFICCFCCGCNGIVLWIFWTCTFTCTCLCICRLLVIIIIITTITTTTTTLIIITTIIWNG